MISSPHTTYIIQILILQFVHEVRKEVLPNLWKFEMDYSWGFIHVTISVFNEENFTSYLKRYT